MDQHTWGKWLIHSSKRRKDNQLCKTWNSPVESNQWFQRYGFRKVWPKCCLIWQASGPWASPYGANRQITMTLHNYRSRQVHWTWNWINPSNSFRDMRSIKSEPNLWQIWQVFGPLASPYGSNGHMTCQCTTTGLENSTELRMAKIRQAVTEIWVLQVWQPPAWPPGPWRPYPSSPEGWELKSIPLKNSSQFPVFHWFLMIQDKSQFAITTVIFIAFVSHNTIGIC